MFCRHVFGNISCRFRGISRFLGKFAGFRGNTWISRVRARSKYQKPWLLLFHFCAFLSQLSELVWKLAKEISLQVASKHFPSFGPPANGNENDTNKSRFCPNRNLTGTMYHWSVILRSFSVVLNSAKCDANGFFKVLLLSSHLLISWHPVQKSKFGACTVMGYCSFNRGLPEHCN